VSDKETAQWIKRAVSRIQHRNRVRGHVLRAVESGETDDVMPSAEMEEIIAEAFAVECTAPAPQPAWFDHDWISKARQIKEGKTDLHRADLLKSIAEAYAAAATPQVTPELEPGKFLNTFCGIVPAGR
jgi:hypothetical protein